MQSPRDVRKAAGVSQMKAAVDAGVSMPLVRLYEANPEAVSDPGKRRSLDRVYAGYAAAVANAEQRATAG